MKKFFIALSAAALVLGATSCNNSSASAEDQAFADSLALAFGQFQGTQLKMQQPQMKAQFGDEFNEDEFLRGYNAAAKLDTANVAYMLGYSIGIQNVYQAHNWGKSGVKVNPAKIAEIASKAYKDSLDIQTLYMKFQQLNDTLQKKIRAAEEAKAKAEAEKNLAEGKEYVAKLKAEDSAIMTSESGLSYKILAEGEGEKVADGSNVKVIYVGKHIDGSEFDNSKGEAIEFNVDRVVAGFSEGLKLLGKGGKAILYIPGNLGYGEGGQPQGGIKPNETLVFEVEVVDFEVPALEAEAK